MTAVNQKSTLWPVAQIVAEEASVPFLSERMYSLISFRKSTPPQNRHLNILTTNSKQWVDEFMAELTFET